MKTIIVILISFAISGCAHFYSKPGAGNMDLQRDHNDCLVKAGQAGFHGGGFAENMNRSSFIEQCLAGQGWSQR